MALIHLPLRLGVPGLGAPKTGTPPTGPRAAVGGGGREGHGQTRDSGGDGHQVDLAGHRATVTPFTDLLRLFSSQGVFRDLDVAAPGIEALGGPRMGVVVRVADGDQVAQFHPAVLVGELGDLFVERQLEAVRQGFLIDLVLSLRWSVSITRVLPTHLPRE
ncbi:MAG: hypothetical protein WDN45_12280 [Caulobacteraceae bacterium]